MIIKYPTNNSLGMGGSAIGGDVVKVLIQSECSVPMIVNGLIIFLNG